MFRLPVCPRCGTVYRYKDVWREIKKHGYLWKRDGTDSECYHCHEKFKVSSMPGAPVLILLWAGLSIGTNLLLLSHMKDLNLLIMMAATLCYMAIAVLFLPFFVRFKQTETIKTDKMNTKKKR